MDLCISGILPPEDGTLNAISIELSEVQQQFKLLSYAEIMTLWMRRVSICCEKTQLKLLFNRNKKSCNYHYENQLSL